MNNLPLSPDELFRPHQRGMLDPQSVISQILLNMIEVSERQQHAVLLEMVIATLSGLSRDVAALADLLGRDRRLYPIFTQESRKIYAESGQNWVY